jgi:hypothetical protein
VYLLDDLIEHGLRVVPFLTNEDVSHPLSNEIKRLAVVFIPVQMICVVFEIDFWFSRLLLNFFEKKLGVLACPLPDLAGDIDVCDERP